MGLFKTIISHLADRSFVAATFTAIGALGTAYAALHSPSISADQKLQAIEAAMGAITVVGGLVIHGETKTNVATANNTAVPPTPTITVTPPAPSSGVTVTPFTPMTGSGGTGINISVDPNAPPPVVS